MVGEPFAFWLPGYWKVGVPDCVTATRLVFEPMALLMTPRAIASGLSVFALPGLARSSGREEVGAP